MSLFLSVRLSVAQHISGTVHYVIIIFFLRGGGLNLQPNFQKKGGLTGPQRLEASTFRGRWCFRGEIKDPDAHYAGDTIMHHMIMIFGTLVQSDDISRVFFHFFKILLFLVVMG